MFNSNFFVDYCLFVFVIRKKLNKHLFLLNVILIFIE